jgi:serine/threonine protein kinase
MSAHTAQPMRYQREHISHVAASSASSTRKKDIQRCLNALCRLNGHRVAAKVAFGRDPEWIQELENEAQVLDELQRLQGSTIPQKIYAGPVHGGKDRLLVTRLVEGKRLDKAIVTPAVVKSARKALSEIHNLGYTHGDIEPRNILVENGGQCIFVDLGRARRAKNESAFRRERAELEATLRNKW